MIQPILDRVLVRPEKEAGERMEGSIVIPQTENMRRMPMEGEIVAAGSRADGLKPGDRVLIPRYGGQEIKNGELRFFKCEEIIATIE